MLLCDVAEPVSQVIQKAFMASLVYSGLPFSAVKTTHEDARLMWVSARPTEELDILTSMTGCSNRDFNKGSKIP